MTQCTYYASIAIITVCMCSVVTADLASTWKSCNCYWGTWEAWSTCTKSCGGGYQKRMRKVGADDVPECGVFENCASNDMGWDYQACNRQCSHGGTFQSSSGFFSGFCSCAAGFHGPCCEEEVTCGSPGPISHGSYIVKSYKYNGKVEYNCNPGYTFRDPSKSTVRTCTGSYSGYWTGNAPECAYALSCNSYPCKNGATCTNLPGDYKCMCRHNWSGRNCDIDIQPPVVTGCPKHKTTNVTSMTSNQTWTEPVFKDPHGFNVTVSKNYPLSSYEFPWGVHTVQYTAVKPSNGLSAECTFVITVKPNPCPTLNPPEHGIVVCNGWHTDYAKICHVYCLNGFTLHPGSKRSIIYVCLATGEWSPQSYPFNCIKTGVFANDVAESLPAFTSCSVSDNAVAKQYIHDLKQSVFHSLCDGFTAECNERKTKIRCG
ncbi:neurogenic locus notch homolog protein 3-like [Dreissena polymorpha]|uniref:Uncharacterized protein n=1 Tax=Dreissena polymorpha TaxID=45954 RepID=A0A9D4BY87_DREPO|nr:neurogenic locus notch homolog protein 3-like [Dreissena polymorpha]KAH3713149.1 hypothetical protein DPMN_072934 [Dreissena polymorpha]